MAHTPGPWTYEFVWSDESERALPKSEWTGLYIGPLNEETGGISHTIFEGGVTHGRTDGDPEADVRLVIAAPNLLAIASTMTVSGPDDDGLLWLMFSGPHDGGPKGALSVKAKSIAGRALSMWRDGRDAALALVEGRADAPGIGDYFDA